MNHLIKKQIIDLRLGKSSDAFRMQHAASAHYWKEVVPVLQKVFDKISNEGEVIELDKLEIDLGIISEKSIEQNKWIDGLELKMEKQLRELLLSSQSGKRIVRSSKPVSVCMQWLFYMKNGYLPWNTVKVVEQWYDHVIEALAVDFESVYALRNLIETDFSVLKRIVWQHPDKFLINLVEIITAKNQSELQVVIQELYILLAFLQEKNKEKGIRSEKEFKRNVWTNILLLATGVHNDFSTANISAQIVRSFVNENILLQKLPVKISAKLKTTSLLIEQFSRQLKALHQKENEKISKAAKKLKDKSPAEITNKNKERKELQNEELQNNVQQQSPDKIEDDLQKRSEKVNTPEKTPEKNIADAIGEEGIFATNAGVVLLHPFLPVLFNRLQLLHERQFIDMLSHQKALHLLHWLATGNVYVEEHELVIAKILCAYPLRETADTGLELSKEELSEAGDMLTATIQQWSILKNTSHVGLREGFLQRSGKLYSRNDKLYLQVEQSSIDMLLDHLPWNLSMIKLPWIDDVLRVEWR